MAVVNFFAAPAFLSQVIGTQATDDVVFMTVAGGHLAFLYFMAFAVLYTFNKAEQAANGAASFIPAGGEVEFDTEKALLGSSTSDPVTPRRSVTPRFLADLAVWLKPFSRRLRVFSLLALFGFFPLIIYTFAGLQNNLVFLLSLAGWLFGFTWQTPWPASPALFTLTMRICSYGRRRRDRTESLTRAPTLSLSWLSRLQCSGSFSPRLFSQ